MRKSHRKALHRARNIGRAAAAGWGGTIKASAAGAVAQVALSKLSEESEFVAAHPVVVPGAMLLGGHFLRRKFPTVGIALCGAAGYALAAGVEASGGIKAMMPGAAETTETKGVIRVQAAQIADMAARRALNAAGMGAGSPAAEAAGVMRQHRT